MSEVDCENGKGSTCKTGAIDVLYAMVRDKESLLPTHKDSPTVVIGHCQVRSLQFVFNMSECWEALPVDHVFLFRGTPITSQEAVTAADNLCVKVSCELWPVLRQASYP